MVIPNARDLKFMRAALAEARKGLGQTSPNPTVGAVIVKGSRILGRGYHHGAGQPHAEIEAIRSLGDPTEARGATIYITLEPCSTHGRTPPCTDSILSLGFKRVVYAATDPNPAHAGRALRIMKKSGIETTVGVLASECTELNEAWNHWITTGRPYVIAKCGMSLDGRISSHPESRWITSEASREDAMDLRTRVDAILVGGQTVRTDDPHLTIRNRPEARQPWRVVWSKSGNLPSKSRIFNDENKQRTLVFTNQSLEKVLAELGRKEITSVLIEGGSRTLGEAFDRKLVNRVEIYTAPQILGGGAPSVGGRGVADNDAAIRLDSPRYRRIGSDIKISGTILR